MGGGCHLPVLSHLITSTALVMTWQACFNLQCIFYIHCLWWLYSVLFPLNAFKVTRICIKTFIHNHIMGLFCWLYGLICLGGDSSLPLIGVSVSTLSLILLQTLKGALHLSWLVALRSVLSLTRGHCRHRLFAWDAE